MSGREESDIVGTMLVSFKSPDPRFEDERIYAYFDGVAYTVVNYARGRVDGLWHVGMTFVLGPVQLEAIQRIKPLHLSLARQNG